MKTVRDKLIEEKVKLIDCKEGDRVYISSGRFRAFVTLEKIKRIQQNQIQIKYRKYKLDTIQKVNLPDSLVVERTRKATADDHEVNTFIPPVVREIDGVSYIVTDENAAKQAEDALPVPFPSSEFSLLDMIPARIEEFLFRIDLPSSLPSSYIGAFLNISDEPRLFPQREKSPSLKITTETTKTIEAPFKMIGLNDLDPE